MYYVPGLPTDESVCVPYLNTIFWTLTYARYRTYDIPPGRLAWFPI